MSDLYKKIANMIGQYLNFNDIQYSFEHKISGDQDSVKYMCGITFIIVSTNVLTHHITGSVNSGKEYKLLEELEEFKKEIRAKCILK